MNRFLVQLKEDVELAIDYEQKRNFGFVFFTWLKVIKLWLLAKLVKDEITEHFTFRYLNPIKFYKKSQLQNFRIFSELKVLRFKNKQPNIEDASRWEMLVKWATTAPPAAWRKAGTLQQRDYYNWGAPPHKDAIKVVIETFQNKRFGSYRELYKFWSDKVLQFPNERKFYKVVQKSAKYNKGKIEQMIKENGIVTGKELAEII